MIYTLKRCYKWPLYIFAPVQKIKIALTKFYAMKKFKALSTLCKLSHFKMTGSSCTDTVRKRVTSFQQVAHWATIAHLGASIMFGDVIIYDAQRQVTLNLKQ